MGTGRAHFQVFEIIDQGQKPVKRGRFPVIWRAAACQKQKPLAKTGVAQLLALARAANGKAARARLIENTRDW